MHLEAEVRDDIDKVEDEYENRWRWHDYGVCGGFGYEEFTAKHDEERNQCHIATAMIVTLKSLDTSNYEEADETPAQSSSTAEAKESEEKNHESGSDTGSENTADDAQSSPHCDESE